VQLGYIVGIFGVRGGLRIHSYTDPREEILAYPRWWLGSGPHRCSYELRGGRRQGGRIIAELDGIDDREAARDLLGRWISVPRAELLEIDGYYWADLFGIGVVNREGIPLGYIDGYIPAGAHDVMIVRDGKRERLIPYAIGTYILEIDLDRKRMVVDWNPED